MHRLFGHLAVVRRALVFYAPPAKMHQHLIDRQPVQPGRKRRIAAKTADLAEKLDKTSCVRSSASVWLLVIRRQRLYVRR